MQIHYDPFKGLILYFDPNEAREAIAILEHLKGEGADDSTSVRVLGYFQNKIKGESNLIH